MLVNDRESENLPVSRLLRTLGPRERMHENSPLSGELGIFFLTRTPKHLVLSRPQRLNCQDGDFSTAPLGQTPTHSPQPRQLPMSI